MVAGEVWVGSLAKRTQLDEVADGAHGDEAHGNGLGDFDKLFAVGCR